MTSVHHGFGIKNLVQNKPIGKSHRDPLPRLLEQLLQRAGAVAGQKFGSKIRVKNYAEKEPFRAVARALQALFFMSSVGELKEVPTYP